MLRHLCYILLPILFSCSNPSEERLVNGYPQRWLLTAMSTGLSGKLLKGVALPWTETLELSVNKRFVKTRWTSNEEQRAGGSFDYLEINGEKYLILRYDAEIDWLESCSNERQTETLFIPTPTSLTGGAAACDGPGLFYERIE